MKLGKTHHKLVKVILGALLVAVSLLGPVTALVDAVDGSIPKELIVSFEEPDQTGDYVYLSDLDYLPSSRSGWGNILKDTTSAGGKITLKQDGFGVSFDKGMWAHATSNLYYDLSDYQEYDYFTAYIGVNTTANSSGSVKFHIYTSTDDTLNAQTNWVESDAINTDVMNPSANAQFVRVNIKGAKYLRLYADANGANSNDHAVYGDAKLIKSGYQQYIVPEASSFNTQIEDYYGKQGASTDSDPGYEITLLRRNLVKNAGQYTLTAFVRESAENRETLEWLYNDLSALRMYTTGGQPTGSYLASLRALSRLYHSHGDDLRNRYGDLYQRMMIALSLTHSTEVRFWVRDQGPMAGNPESPNISDPVRRYEVYKGLYLDNRLATTIFQSLEVEEMRYIMATELGDEEILWLNDYMKIHYPNKWPKAYAYPPVPYISIGNHYWREENYAEENQQKWIDKYHLVGDNYSISFAKNAPHLWMVMQHGGVCWQISNTGQNMTASQGIPSTTFGQPGHLAYANYEVHNGTPVWALTNDVSGWTKTDYTGYTNTHTYHQVRQLNNWGANNKGYASRYQGTYIIMAQSALNDFDNYEKSQEQVLLADTYAGDLNKQEEIYRQALNTQSINLDAWLGLINTYRNNPSKTESDYLELAKEIATSLELFPLPMYDMLRLITPKVTSPGYNSSLIMLQTRTLESATKTPNSAHAQAGVTRTMANYLLGQFDNEIATFSFDGDADTAGYLKLGSRYADSLAAWEYSLDGGNTWSSGENSDQWITEKARKLSDEEIRSITSENDIKVHIQGVNRAEENIYTIDITEQSAPNNLYANDLENRVMGVNMTMDWRYVTGEGDSRTHGSWKSYLVESPDLTGEKTVQIRIRDTGTKLASKASNDYVFHTDPDDLGGLRHYIPVSHLSIAGVSSQATGNNGSAAYSIDGNFNTRWHSAWNGSDHDKWITIKFDHPTDLSAIEYIPAGGGNGRILQADIYGSTSDGGENDSFVLIGKISSNCTGVTVPCMSPWPNQDNYDVRSFEFGHSTADGEFTYDSAKNLRYVKIVGTQTSSASSLSFIAARMFNFYEDMVSDPHPTAGVAYSTTEPISGPVVARLINPSMEIEITSEGGDTHTFYENGEHIFAFHEKGNPANSWQAIAKVDWIHYDAPEGTVVYTCVDANGTEYDCRTDHRKTNSSVRAELVFPEGVEVTIINNGQQNGGASTDFEEVAPNPDEGDNAQDSDIDSDSLNPFTHLFMDNGRFVFEYVDKAGNKGVAVAEVDWIDKIPPIGIVEYSTLDSTTGKVTAKLIKANPSDEDFTVTNNNGSNEYTFEKNGEFNFEYRDEAGNYTTTLAKVDWIKEQTSKPEEIEPNQPDKPNSGDQSGNNSGNSGNNQGNQSGNNSGNQGSQGNQGGSQGNNSGSNNNQSQNSSDNQNNNNIANNTRPNTPNIKVEASGLPEGGQSNSQRVNLDAKLEQKFGENSELYELSFTDADGNHLEQTPSEILITVPSDKKLHAVYLVDENGNTRKVEYERVDDTHIRIKNPSAGKYLFDYEDEESDKKNSETNKDSSVKQDEAAQPEEESGFNTKILLWGGIALAIIIVLIIVYGMIGNRRR